MTPNVMYIPMACVLAGLVAVPSNLAAAERSYAPARQASQGTLDPAFDPNRRTPCPAQNCRSSPSANALCVIKDGACVWNNVPLYLSPYDQQGVGGH